MAKVVALDLGTSALKAIRFAEDGTVAAARALPVATARAEGRAEQDPHEWWAAARDALGAVLTGDVAALALSGTMQNLVPTRADGTPDGPAILYSDARVGDARRAELEARLPPDLAAHIGNAPMNALPLFKIMEGWGNGADHLHFGAKDALIERLTGARAVDPTVATTTGLMDLRAGDWDDAILDAIGLARDRLPAITRGDAVVGETSGADGIPPGIPVVCGAGDAGAAAWGAGAEGAGAAHVYVGTSGWVAMTLPAVPDDLPRDAYVLAMPTGREALMIAPVTTAGAAVDWAAALTGRDVAAALDALPGAMPDRDAPAPPLFLPYLSGERSPFQDDAVRGAFLGLDAAHGPDDLVAAALEGVGHALRHCLDALGRAFDPAGEVMAIGGGFRHPAGAARIAAASGTALRPSRQPTEATAYGAARLARRALGLADFPPLPANAVLAARTGIEGRARYDAYRQASDWARGFAHAIPGR